MTFKDIEHKYLGNYSSFEAYLEAHRTYGFSMVLIDQFQITETISKGIKEPITPNTMFQAASISKSIFAVTLMKMHEMNMINLNQNLIEPIQALLDVPNTILRMTFYDLLSHTAGLNLHGFAGYLHDQSLPSVLQIIKGERPANSLGLQFVHHTKAFSYSGGGYMLAQHLIESMTQKTMDTWIESLIFSSLKMTRSQFSLHALPKEDYASAWNADDRPIEGGYLIHPELAAAGLWSTPTDLARFGIEMMKAIHGKSDWLSQKNAQLMVTPVLNDGSHYGLGFQLGDSHPTFWFGHGGDNTGYHANMRFDPTNGRGVIIMVNSEIGEEIPHKWVDWITQEWSKTKKESAS